MDISIVIPVFNEGGKIAADVNAAAGFCAEHLLSAEIIVVDDGSTDDTAAAAGRAMPSPPAGITLTVIKCEHLGKGHAVKTGIGRSTGRYVMFADSGGCVPYQDVLKGLTLIDSGQADAAHGSRKLAESLVITPHKHSRRLTAALFRWFTIVFMGVPRTLTDTQCGFKVYPGDTARKLYGECVTNGFCLDIEVVLRALKSGLRIKEFPVRWRCDRDSRLKIGGSCFRILSELLKIKKAQCDIQSIIP